MDLRRFDSVTRSEAGVECKLLDPMTKSDSGASLVLFGVDSSIYKQIEKEQQARHKNLGRALSVEEIYEDTIEKAARMTKDWKGFSLDGKELPFSQEEAKKVYKAYPYIFDAAATFMFTRTNFFEKASGN